MVYYYPPFHVSIWLDANGPAWKLEYPQEKEPVDLNEEGASLDATVRHLRMPYSSAIY